MELQATDTRCCNLICPMNNDCARYQAWLNEIGGSGSPAQVQAFTPINEADCDSLILEIPTKK